MNTRAVEVLRNGTYVLENTCLGRPPSLVFILRVENDSITAPIQRTRTHSWRRRNIPVGRSQRAILPVEHDSITALTPAPIYTPVYTNAHMRRWEEIIWRDVRTGDILRVEGDDNVPSDLVILSTNLPDGACFVETAELDGYV